MRTRLDSRSRGNATVIALIALVTALLALIVALLALFSGGSGTDDVRQDALLELESPPQRGRPHAPEEYPYPPSPSPLLGLTGTQAAPPIQPAAVVEVEAVDEGSEVAQTEAPTVDSPEAAAPAQAVGDPTPTEVVAEMPSESKLVDGPAHETEPSQTESADVGETSGETSGAGRSPIPEEGENLTAPIAAERLVDEPTGPAPEGVIPWTEAGQHVGQKVTTRGRIVNTHKSGAVTFLNFDTDWRDKFYIIIFSDAYDGIPGGDPELAYLHQTIEVTGEVKTHKGRPQIQVRDASQIVVVEE